VTATSLGARADARGAVGPLQVGIHAGGMRGGLPDVAEQRAARLGWPR
jgi:hypothetical protein